VHNYLNHNRCLSPSLEELFLHTPFKERVACLHWYRQTAQTTMIDKANVQPQLEEELKVPPARPLVLEHPLGVQFLAL
jgi:hypothetical protein